MNSSEAKVLLSFHSGRNSDIDNEKWRSGFLGSLRPFTGELKKENFIEVMECLYTLRDELSAPEIDRETMANIAGIMYFARIWASPHGMLGSSHLLTEQQTCQLLFWVDMIQYCFTCLLDGAEEEAFHDYRLYLAGELSENWD